MAKRQQNYCLVKIHRSYTVEEVARVLSVHRNTVLNWIKSGLSTIDDKRPFLIQGLVLRQFLQDRRKKNKQKCKPGELYCVRCRQPKLPAGDMLEYGRVSDTIGQLKAICPDCDAIMNQRVGIARMNQIREKKGVTVTKAQ